MKLRVLYCLLHGVNEPSVICDLVGCSKPFVSKLFKWLNSLGVVEKVGRKYEVVWFDWLFFFVAVHSHPNSFVDLCLPFNNVNEVSSFLLSKGVNHAVSFSNVVYVRELGFLKSFVCDKGNFKFVVDGFPLKFATFKDGVVRVSDVQERIDKFWFGKVTVFRDY